MVSYIGQGMLQTDRHCYSSIMGHKVVLFQSEYPPGEAQVKNSDLNMAQDCHSGKCT